MLNIVKIKGMIKDNRLANMGAEIVLELFVTIRYLLKGSFSQYGEDLAVSRVFEGGG